MARPAASVIPASLIGHFWDHDRETTLPTYTNVYAVAADFAAFLDSLHDPGAR